MADLSISISNTLNVFGSDAPDLWGEMIWGTGKWAIVDIRWFFDKGIAAGSITLTSEADFQVLKSIDNTLAVTGDMSSETLASGIYFYSIDGSTTTNLETRVGTSYTQSSTTAIAYSSTASPSTTWS